MISDYSSAPDDATAAGVLDEPGGPQPADRDVLPFKGIDPVVATRCSRRWPGATPAVLTEVGATWAASEELRPYDDGDVLPDGLLEWAGLARRAHAAGHRLYCFWAL